jgi:hypothetical protein
MDDMVAQGFGAYYYLRCMIAIAGIVFLLRDSGMRWSMEIPFILWSGAIILGSVSLYTGCGLLLRKYGII